MTEAQEVCIYSSTNTYSQVWGKKSVRSSSAATWWQWGVAFQPWEETPKSASVIRGSEGRGGGAGIHNVCDQSHRPAGGRCIFTGVTGLMMTLTWSVPSISRTESRTSCSGLRSSFCRTWFHQILLLEEEYKTNNHLSGIWAAAARQVGFSPEPIRYGPTGPQVWRQVDQKLFPQPRVWNPRRFSVAWSFGRNANKKK